MRTPKLYTCFDSNITLISLIYAKAVNVGIDILVHIVLYTFVDSKDQKTIKERNNGFSRSPLPNNYFNMLQITHKRYLNNEISPKSLNINSFALEKKSSLTEERLLFFALYSNVNNVSSSVFL